MSRFLYRQHPTGGGQIAALRTPLGVGTQGASQVIVVVNQQVDPYDRVQATAEIVQTERLNGLPMESADRRCPILPIELDQRLFGRLGVVAKQLDLYVGVPGGRPAPDRRRKVRAKLRESPHPLQGKLAQRQQLLRLGVGAK